MTVRERDEKIAGIIVSLWPELAEQNQGKKIDPMNIEGQALLLAVHFDVKVWRNGAGTYTAEIDNGRERFWSGGGTKAAAITMTVCQLAKEYVESWDVEYED